MFCCLYTLTYIYIYIFQHIFQRISIYRFLHTSTVYHRWGAPGPLKCGPKSLYPQTGHWNYLYACDNKWATPPEYCEEYVEQKGGKAMNDDAYPNAGELVV